jgi:phosphatidylserine decarboxylase
MLAIKRIVNRLLQHEGTNFWLTNRIPRYALTRFMGWFSRIEHPWVARLSIAVWRFFADNLRLDEAKKASFTSLHDCFIRELKDGVRPVDLSPSVITSPCDAVVGMMGAIQGTDLLQAKGFTYTLEELLDAPALAERYRNGCYVTLRLKSSMYHRFHVPCDCTVRKVNYIAGDVWNVNPVALRRVERLFCRNERVVIPLQTVEFGQAVTLVPVAAVLVASIHLHFLDVLLNLTYGGPNRIACDAAFKKGEEMGYFHHGSTMLVFATDQLKPCKYIQPGEVIRMGQPLLQAAQH